MKNKYNRLFRKDDGDGDFWPSFTDMLTTILLVVLLYLTVTIQNEQEKYAEAKAEVQEQIKALEKEQKENEQYRVTLNNVIGIKKEIIENLKVAFQDSDLQIEIDSQTGAIKFQDNLLFETSKSTIAPEFKEQLREFIPQYFEILFSDYDNDIAEILIEGHTDDVGSFNYNLELSQERAFSVVQYILSDEFGELPYKDQVQNRLTANGRSYSDPKYLENTDEIDREKSRRVEFKFRLFTEAEIEELAKVMEEKSKEMNEE